MGSSADRLKLLQAGKPIQEYFYSSKVTVFSYYGICSENKPFTKRF